MYIAVAVLILYFFIAPIYVTARCDIDSFAEYSRSSVKIFAWKIISVRIYLDRLLHKINTRADKSIEQAQDMQNDVQKSKIKQFAVKFALQAVKRVIVSNAELDVTIGTGDAAVDALICGSANLISKKLFKAFDVRRAHVSIKPDYDTERVCVDFFGIFCFNIANIIVAALCAFAVYMRGKRRGHAVILGRT